MTTFIQERARQLPDSWRDDYLDWLGVDQEAPGREALSRLIRCHMQAVAFENVTAILRRGAHPDGDVPEIDPLAMLANWRDDRGGGVCFEIASMFTMLLEKLGYDVRPILAQISFAGGHQAVIVNLDGADWLIDIGGASPTFEPVSLTRTTEVYAAGLGYRFRQGDGPEQWLQERLIDDVWTIHCRYDLRPLDEQLRREAYQRHHTHGQTWVIDRLRVVRVCDDAVLKLTEDARVLHTPDSKQENRFDTETQFIAAVQTGGGLPNLPVREALEILERLERHRH